MEEHRFDDLTRALGAARSRRQVLKGVLGGVAALVLGRVAGPLTAEAAPAEVCDRRKCEQEAGQIMVSCLGTCQRLFHRHGAGNPTQLAVCKLGCVSGFELEKQQCRTSPSGCLTDACCDQQCVSLETNPNNCGACGNRCEPGHDCIEGVCQCDDGETYCDQQCIDTETDNANCGGCGTVCSGCETCLGGVCQPLDCGTGQTCCQHLCIPECQGAPPDLDTCLCDPCDGQANGLSCGPNKVCCNQVCASDTCPQGRTFDLETCACQCTPVTCPAGQTQDPTTCQCVSLCLTATDGTSCGTNMECCSQQCVSNQCPSGKHFDRATCACACDPIECPGGEHQDPNSCACVGGCTESSCGECETCNGTTGVCDPASDQTPCDTNQVCCGGFCLDSCDGPLCDDGQYACAVTPTDGDDSSRPAFVCCDNGAPCCGGNGYFYDICVGSTYEGTDVCCAPGKSQCGTECCDYGTQSCLQAGDFSQHCCPADAGDVLPDGTCCDPDSSRAQCSGGPWFCCSNSASDCCG